MRLLLRANAHRWVWGDGSRIGVEVAASPDTPTRPERWAWHIRLLDNTPQLNLVSSTESPDAATSSTRQVGVDTTRLDVSSGALGTVEVEVDPELVRAHAEVLDIGTDLVLERAEKDLLALVATSGEVILEDRHRLAAGDAIVLTGDDPLAVSVSTSHGCAVVIRLQAPQGGPVGWVP